MKAMVYSTHTHTHAHTHTRLNGNLNTLRSEYRPVVSHKHKEFRLFNGWNENCPDQCLKYIQNQTFWSGFQIQNPIEQGWLTFLASWPKP